LKVLFDNIGPRLGRLPPCTETTKGLKGGIWGHELKAAQGWKKLLYVRFGKLGGKIGQITWNLQIPAPG
jgi:hypothetical protein